MRLGLEGFALAAAVLGIELRLFFQIPEQVEENVSLLVRGPHDTGGAPRSDVGPVEKQGRAGWRARFE